MLESVPFMVLVSQLSIRSNFILLVYKIAAMLKTNKVTGINKYYGAVRPHKQNSLFLIPGIGYTVETTEMAETAEIEWEVSRKSVQEKNYDIT